MAPPEYSLGIEILDLFERQAVIDPRMPGEQHPTLPDLWLFETPNAVVRLPRLVVVYTIDDRRGAIDLWNLYRL